MSLEKQKWGTCENCRWCAPDGVCVRFPNVNGFYEVADDATCGEWEPPAGKVCGNCEHLLEYMNTDIKACKVRATATGYRDQTHLLNSCSSWRWNGGKP